MHRERKNSEPRSSLWARTAEISSARRLPGSALSLNTPLSRPQPWPCFRRTKGWTRWGKQKHQVVIESKITENFPPRYDLVPKKVKEDEFWRNYFYRVSLIKQSFELKDLEKEEKKQEEKKQEKKEEKSKEVSNDDVEIRLKLRFAVLTFLVQNHIPSHHSVPPLMTTRTSYRNRIRHRPRTLPRPTRAWRSSESPPHLPTKVISPWW